MSYVMKIRPVGAQLFRVDGLTNGQIHTTELSVVFQNFENAPKTPTHEFHRFTCTNFVL
jgi:hypothetical protein